LCFTLLKHHRFILAIIYLSHFSNFTIFVKITPDNYYRQADVGNQLKVHVNAMLADNAQMQQCTKSHCAYKMAAMLTHETSELTDTAAPALPPSSAARVEL